VLLQGRKAIVTGASSGIGKATSIRLAHEGASVCVNYYSDKESGDANAVVEAVKSAGAQGVAVQADVGDEDAVTTMVAKAVDALGGLDLLVNNAGIEKQVPLLEMSEKDWSIVLQTNLTGAFLCMREAAKVMVEGRGGVIVNMSSVHEFIPWPGFAHYCATKGGLKLLMETAARELAPKGVRVCATSPPEPSPRPSTTSCSTTPRPSTPWSPRYRLGGWASLRRSPQRWCGQPAMRPAT
jgi:glucose 1-dehydrogenase